jgi:hypothetical protein
MVNPLYDEITVVSNSNNRLPGGKHSFSKLLYPKQGYLTLGYSHNRTYITGIRQVRWRA